MGSGTREKLTYAVITPARDEEATLPGLSAALHAQTVLPESWTIVENGSSDGTLVLAEGLEAETRWIHVDRVEGSLAPQRGAPIVRALMSTLPQIDPSVDVVANVDADVTFGVDYFERLLTAFEADPRLGIASGRAYELSRQGDWRAIDITGGSVWGATRAYRRTCLDDVLPLESRHGWDGMDQLKARSRGWRTRTILDLPFFHHRPEGERDGSSWAHWRQAGETAHYMGYRPWYLALRTAHNLRRSPAAIAMSVGYLGAAARRGDVWQDADGRAVLKADQSLRKLVRRRQEALGRVPPEGADAETVFEPSEAGRR